MCSALCNDYFEGGYDFCVVEGGGIVVEAGEELLLEHDDHDFLPEGEEDSDFDGEELEEGSVGGEGFVEGVVEEDEVVKGVGSGDADDPADAGGDEEVGGVVLGHVGVVVGQVDLVGVDNVHEQRGQHLHHHELHHVLLAPVCEVLGLLPVGELVGFLAVSEGPEVVHFLLVLDHYHVHLFVLHYVLTRASGTRSRS